MTIVRVPWNINRIGRGGKIHGFVILYAVRPWLRSCSTCPQDPYERLARPRSVHGRCHSRPGHGCRPTSQFRAPRGAHGHGRHRPRAVDAAPAPQPGRPGLDRPRPLRAVQRPRLDAALRPAAPHRLRPADRRTAPVPATAFAHARPPRSRGHAGRRDHHRSAGPGPGQRRRHGARPGAAGGRIQSPGTRTDRPRHLRLRRRRLPDGRHFPRSLLAGRHPGPVAPDRVLRRQRHLHRRRGPGLVRRRHPGALRGLRLERPARGRRP